MKIISFSGVDGSGKSTQRELLQDHLEKNGYRVSYFHATEFSFANRAHRKAKKKDGFIPGSEKAVTKASFITVLARLFFLVVDGIRFQSYERCLDKAGVTVLVSDRFFQDSLLNICYLSKNPLIRFLVRVIANFLPQAEYRFYLKVSAEDVLKRDRVPEQGEEYLKEKIALYNKHPFYWNTHTIDATQSPGLIHQNILAHLGDL